ncbi:ABC transporter substrate-binding protein [Nocardioides sp. TF02-7]|nr:ABC transporter substrate-binding protein [Nocardioides sp. TF02-7]
MGRRRRQGDAVVRGGAHRRSAGRRLRAVPAGRGHRRRVDVPLRGQPDYWRGAPHVDEVVFRVFQSEDPAVQALVKGEVDYVEGISALQVEALGGRDGILAQNASTTGFDEIAFNAGSVDLETGEPIGDPNPAVLDPEFRYALGFAVDRERLVETVYQGAGEPGSTIVPPGLAQYHWEPPADELGHDPERAAELLDEAGYTVGDDGLRTLPDGSPMGDPAAVRALRLRHLHRRDDVLPGVAGRPRHRGGGHQRRVVEADRRDPRGRVRRLRVGLVRRRRPHVDAQLHDLRPARQLVGLVVLRRGVRRAVRGAGRRARPRDPGRADPPDAGDPVARRALPPDRLQHHRAGGAQRPLRLPAEPAEPGRPVALPAGGSTPTSRSGRPTRPATATGSARRRPPRRARGPTA